MLLLDGLELAMTKLGRSVDKLELNLLQISSRGMDHQALSDRQHTLLCAGHATLEHQEVILHDAIVRETAKGCDRLFSSISISATVLWVIACANTIDLLVQLGTVVVAI